MKVRYIIFFEWVESKPFALWLVGVFSFLWLVVGVPFLSLHNDGVRPVFSPEKKGNQDLAHYYMGGAILLEGEFGSLYPEPIEGMKANVGWPDSSRPKPGYRSIAEERGVENSFRYILPPPTTLILAPLALLPYSLAQWAWVGFLGFCCWSICFFSFRMGIRSGLSPFWGLVWWCVWAFSPLMLKTIRTANSTPIVALALGLGAWGIFKNKNILAVSGCIVAGLLKGTSLVFSPLIFFMKRWGIAGWGVIGVVAINVVTLALAGPDIYREFFEVVYPSTKIPDPFLGNQSFFGFAYRMWGSEGFQPFVVAGIKLMGLLLMGLLLLRIGVVRRRLENDFTLFNSAVLGLLGIYLVFSAYCWDHYVLLYLPFWSVLWGQAKSIWIKIPLLCFVSLVWLPLTVIRGGVFLTCEPFQSHMLWGQIFLIIVAVQGLWRGGKRIQDGE